MKIQSNSELDATQKICCEDFQSGHQVQRLRGLRVGDAPQQRRHRRAVAARTRDLQRTPAQPRPSLKTPNPLGSKQSFHESFDGKARRGKPVVSIFQKLR